jgi:hypothetical protein
MPGAATELHRFYQSYLDAEKAGKSADTYYSWRRTGNSDLAELDHLEPEEVLPENCYERGTHRLQKKQLVWRKKRNFQILYKYNDRLLDSLKQRGDQVSWVLIHEWLWSYLDVVDNVFDVNRFLHSKEFFSAEPRTLHHFFVETGFDYRPNRFMDLMEFTEFLENLKSGWISKDSDPIEHWRMPFLEERYEVQSEKRKADERVAALQADLREIWGKYYLIANHVRSVTGSAPPYYFFEMSEKDWEAAAARVFSLSGLWKTEIQLWEDVYGPVLDMHAYLRFSVPRSEEGPTCAQTGVLAEFLDSVIKKYPTGLSSSLTPKLLGDWALIIRQFKAKKGCP